MDQYNQSLFVMEDLYPYRVRIFKVGTGLSRPVLWGTPLESYSSFMEMASGVDPDPLFNTRKGHDLLARNLVRNRELLRSQSKQPTS